MRLTKLCVGISLWLALAAAGPAAAASTVTLYLHWESGLGPTTAVYGLYAQNSLGVGLGAVDVLVEGATGFNLDPTTYGISAADSVYAVRPLAGQPWDALIINNLALGVTFVPAGEIIATRLGAFLPGDLPYLLPGETPDPTAPGTVLGGTIFDPNLNVITASRFDRARYCDPRGSCLDGGLIITVPEPAAAAAVTLLCLAYLLGGKIRRKSGSVAAPT